MYYKCKKKSYRKKWHLKCNCKSRMWKKEEKKKNEICQKSQDFSLILWKKTIEKKCSSIFFAILMKWQKGFRIKNLTERSEVKIRGQFHQRNYAQLLRKQDPKAQKAAWDDCRFALLGSAWVKAARKMLVKLTLDYSSLVFLKTLTTPLFGEKLIF